MTLPREIAEKVSRSERTVRRYVRDIEPDVKLRPEFGSDQLMDWFYDEILAKRRRLVAAARKKWDESFELGVDLVDETMRSLRERIEAMDEITIRRMTTDEEYRHEYFEEFMWSVLERWVSDLNALRQWREVFRNNFGLDTYYEGGDDDEHEF